MKLTRQQAKLRKEIEDIAEIVGMDHWNILQYRPAGRSIRLLITKAQLVRSAIVMDYAFLDELLTTIICNYFFALPARKAESQYPKLWSTKRFKIFNHQIMDEVYLLKKLNVVRAIRDVPSDIVSAVQRIKI